MIRYLQIKGLRALRGLSSIFLAVLFATMATVHAAPPPPGSLLVGEGFSDPIGFYDPAPVFSWKLPVGVEKQTAYRIETKAGENVWDSGWVNSAQSTLVPYGGRPFGSRDRVEWRVRFKDEKNVDSGWSSMAWFETGLLNASDWQARWISPAGEPDATKEAVAWLRREFSLEKSVARARIYVTARGLFEITLNGSRVGDDHFANGFTSYQKRLDVLTYDVTGQIRQGKNALQVMLGRGWYAGRIPFGRKDMGPYGKVPELLLQLEITYADGSKKLVASDRDWQGTYEGPVISSSIYDGEVYDARKEVKGWKGVKVNAELGSARLMPKPLPPVREEEKLAAANITEPEPGRFIFDLGQNMVGWARVHIPVEKSKTVTIRFAEMLNANGTLYTENYRSAKSVDTYTAAKTGLIEWQPHFTFHGFRYVELSGLPKDARPQKDWITGVALYSDLRPIGKFEASFPKLNRLQSNIIWGQRGNFLDIPTDCPQRDERLGWTGDAEVFCPTAMFNYDTHAFWKSWLSTMRDDQMMDGRIPHVIPDVMHAGGSPGWMDAATIIPWEVYVRTGDSRVLADNFAMMEKLVAYYRAQSGKDLMASVKGFGDWLQPFAKETRGDTPQALLAMAYYAHSSDLVARAAKVLEREGDEKRYSDEATAAKRQFCDQYIDPDGKIKNAPETQTAYVLALAFDLIPADMKAKVGGNLVRLIGEADGHLRTGFLGTPPLLRVLDETGHSDIAYDLLYQATYPSWFYSIDQGATTMWERWNSYSLDKGFGDAGMNSFNHYAYGAVGQWMYERVAGLAPDPLQPGYKHFFIRPLVSTRLDSAKAELDTPYGKAVSEWTKRDGKISMEIVVPPNSTATVEFPVATRKPETLRSGSYHFTL